MRTQIITIAATASLFASQAFAGTELSSSHKPASAKNETVAACVDAIQAYHSKEARLFLNNKATYREVNGNRYLSVQGWVWKNGDRVKVSHECTNTSMDDLALNVVFTDEVQVASN